MHSWAKQSVTKFAKFPDPNALLPDREARAAPPVHPEDVPPALRSVPGSPRDRRQERYFGRNFPEPNFKLSRLTDAYHTVVTAVPGEVTRTYDRLGAKYGDLIDRVNAAARTYHEKPATGTPDPKADLTAAIRRKAKASGIDLVGFTRFDRTYVTAETRGEARFRNAIVLCRAFDWKITDAVPSIEWDVHSYDTSLALALAAFKVADFLRRKGYPVQFIAGTGTPGETMIAPILPYAVEAGLGQIGANGVMLTPEFGSRVRVIGLSTDAPVRYGKPVDFGVNKLCEECQVCVRRCPGRALSNLKVDWRGVRKHKVVADRCLPMLRYAECNICTKVCPVQHFGLKAVLDHYRESGGEILGKDTDALEGYTMFEKGRFGPGDLPRFTPNDGGKGLMKMAKGRGLV